MFCPICGNELKANSWTWYCKFCGRTFEIIEHRNGQVHRYTAGEIMWNPLVIEEG